MKSILSLMLLLCLSICVPTTRPSSTPPAVAASSEFTVAGSQVAIYNFGFQTSQNGWTGGFSDYPAADLAYYELVFARRTLPRSLDSSRWGLYLSGANCSDDLFMYVRRRLSGLLPCTSYRVHFNLEIATNASSGCMGIGGAPGEGVCIKAGASTQPPLGVIDDQGWYRMNIDIGNQYESGANAVILGNIANTNTDCENLRWQYKTLDSGTSFVRAKTDSNGRLWLFTGADSGFEGTTSLYYTRITAWLVSE